MATDPAASGAILTSAAKADTRAKAVKQAKDFVSILEKSEKQNTTLAGSTIVNTKPSDTALKNLLKKRFVLK